MDYSYIKDVLENDKLTKLANLVFKNNSVYFLLYIYFFNYFNKKIILYRRVAIWKVKKNIKMF
jgi:hypothetical protein